MKRYKEIVLKADEGIEYLLKEENNILIVQAKLNSVEKRVHEEDYFFWITSKERKEVRDWVRCNKFKKRQEKIFLANLREALNKVDYDFAISTIEPTIKAGKLFFSEGEQVAVGYTCEELYELCEQYNPPKGSRMANLYELFIWYAYRIIKGYWTLNFVVADSNGANYWSSKDAAHALEKTGARTCGGFKDGQGNTYKIVKCKSIFVAVGGWYTREGEEYSIADVSYNIEPAEIRYNGSCVVTLTRR